MILIFLVIFGICVVLHKIEKYKQIKNYSPKSFFGYSRVFIDFTCFFIYFYRNIYVFTLFVLYFLWELHIRWKKNGKSGKHNFNI